MKFRAELVLAVVDLEAAVEFEATNTDELRAMADKLSWYERTPKPFYLSNDNREYRHVKRIPRYHWNVGDTHGSTPYVRRIINLDTGKVVPEKQYWIDRD